jgi:hypothetical protein
MRRRIVRACVAALTAGIAAAGAPAALAAPTGPVHPGVQTFTNGAQCTANFIYKNATSTYIGQAAHCSGTGTATETNGCDSGSLPIGTAVTVTGASKPGTMVYNSWLAMQAAGESDANTCAYNDLALVKLDAADIGKIDPSVPGFGGPTGVGSAAVGGAVFSYGNSSLRQGITLLSPKQGLVLQLAGGGWSRTVLTVTPGIPGDSGSGFMNATGQAIGVLSTLAVLPLPLTNGVGDLGRELDYARAHGVAGLQLVNGTQPFKGDLVSAILGGGTGGLLARK